MVGDHVHQEAGLRSDYLLSYRGVPLRRSRQKMNSMLLDLDRSKAQSTRVYWI